MIRSMSWVFTGVMTRACDFGSEQARRLNEAYARWHKEDRELPHGRDREQERRLLGTRDREHSDRREGDRTPKFREHLSLFKHTSSRAARRSSCDLLLSVPVR